MRYRWSYSEDAGETWAEVTPTNGSRLSITQARDLSAGQVFFRKKLAQAVILGGADFRAIDAIRRTPARRCETLLLRCESMCGSWSEYWRGEFSAGSAKWDLDNCTVEIKAETVDRYTCLLKRKDEKRNLLNTASVEVHAANLPAGMEIKLSASVAEQTFGKWTSTGDTQVLTYPTGMGACSGYTTSVTIYWRETIITNCVGGVPMPPPGSGWIKLSDSFGGFSGPNFGCDDHGMVKWARAPVATWPFPSAPLVVGAASTGPGELPEPTSPGCSNWYQVETLNCIGVHAAGVYVCLEDLNTTVEYETGRTFRSAVEYLTEQASCELIGVRSDFFEWNAPGDAPGYSAGINYVTGEANDVAQLVLLQKSDAINPGASNPATIGEASFQEIMDLLRVAFRCFWDIDDDGNIRIEHWSYWINQNPLLLAAQGNTIEPMAFEGLGDEIPRLERAQWMEAQGRDFVGKDILYDSPCATGEAKEWSAGRFSTDISFVNNDPDAIGKDGFVLLATQISAGVYQCIIGIGALTGNPISNAPMSWANLENDFWRHDRPLPTGTMNDVITDFVAFLPTVKQEGVSFDACCSSLLFDARKPVRGLLANRLAVDASIESLTHDLYTDRIALMLRYAY